MGRDAVEVVRCRDCKHAADRAGALVCTVHCAWMVKTEPDGYCHRGERGRK